MFIELQRILVQNWHLIKIESHVFIFANAAREKLTLFYYSSYSQILLIFQESAQVLLIKDFLNYPNLTITDFPGSQCEYHTQ